MIEAHRRRQARELDGLAWTVAHLLVGSGKLQKGTRVDALMRGLLGREPGTVPGDTPIETPPANEMTPTASVAYMANWMKARRHA